MDNRVRHEKQPGLPRGGYNGFTARSETSGFTILEVLIAMSILAFALIGLTSLATTNLKSTESAKRLTQSLGIATEKIEATKAIPFANIQNSDISGTPSGRIARTCTGIGASPPVYRCVPTDSPQIQDVMEFTWYWDVTYVDLDGDTEYFSEDEGGTSLAPIIDSSDIKMVELYVTWTDLFGTHETVLRELRSRL